MYDGIRYLELSSSYNEVYHRIDSRIYNTIFERINYLRNEKSDHKYSIIILQESELIHIILYL